MSDFDVNPFVNAAGDNNPFNVRTLFLVFKKNLSQRAEEERVEVVDQEVFSLRPGNLLGRAWGRGLHLITRVLF